MDILFYSYYLMFMFQTMALLKTLRRLLQTILMEKFKSGIIDVKGGLCLKKTILTTIQLAIIKRSDIADSMSLPGIRGSIQVETNCMMIGKYLFCKLTFIILTVHNKK